MKMPHSNPLRVKETKKKKQKKKNKLHLSQAHRLPSVGLQTEVQMKKHCVILTVGI